MQESMKISGWEKGLTHGKGQHRWQSKGHVQQCAKLIELERMDKESPKKEQGWFLPEAQRM